MPYLDEETLRAATERLGVSRAAPRLEVERVAVFEALTGAEAGTVSYGSEHGPRKQRWTGGRALVVLDPDQCPACGAPVTHETSQQPAMLRHGGYGATTEHTLRVCTNGDCRWTCAVQTQEVRP